MSYSKGGIGLIKAGLVLFIHKYVYKKILPQVKSIPQKRTGFPCTPEKYSVVFLDSNEH